MNYVCHTQQVERGIKDLTRVTSIFVQFERDGVLLATNASRKKQSSFRSRSEFFYWKSIPETFEKDAKLKR